MPPNQILWIGGKHGNTMKSATGSLLRLLDITCLSNVIRRIVYAWVHVDLMISLLHDLPPGLSINDLHIPLPHDAGLWHAESAQAWIERYELSAAKGHANAPSLNSLFRSFIRGRLACNNETPVHHLRLLLYPLQSMVLEQQQLLRVFGIDEHSSRNRLSSKIKVLSRLQETQDLLQQMSTLLYSNSSAESLGSGTPNDSMACVTKIMLHLISLNTLISIPETERVASEGHLASAAERVKMWRRIRYTESDIESDSYVLFHAGQIIRLLDELHQIATLPWWPIAAYRAAIACWSLSASSSPQKVCQQPEVSINTLAPAEKIMDAYINNHTGVAVWTHVDGRQVPVLDGNNSLDFCISLLEKQPTRLARNTLAKVRLLKDQWSL